MVDRDGEGVDDDAGDLAGDADPDIFGDFVAEDRPNPCSGIQRPSGCETAKPYREGL